MRIVCQIAGLLPGRRTATLVPFYNNRARLAKAPDPQPGEVRAFHKAMDFMGPGVYSVSAKP